MIKVKTTVYLDEDLQEQLKIKAVLDKKTDTETLNSILRDYFNERGKKA